MKTPGSLCAFLACAATMASINLVLAQHQGHVGVNIILKPIQTIQVDNRYGESNAVQKAINDKDREDVVHVFGTAMYEVVVSKLPLDESLQRSAGNLPEGRLPAERTPAPANRVRVGGLETDIPPSHTLVVYSVQVN